MKRFTLTLLLGLFAVSLQACASGQSVTPQTPSSTSGSSIGSTIGNLLEGVFSRSDIDVADMSGIWTVDGSAVAFKSQDFMAKAGGAAVAAKLQTELDPYYQRYGLTGAVLSIDSDGNCSIKLARGSINGVITKQAKGEFLFNITLLGKTVSSVPLYVRKTSQTMDMMFDVAKLKEILKLVGRFSGNSLASALIDLLDKYEGVYIGFGMHSDAAPLSNDLKQVNNPTQQQEQKNSGLGTLINILNGKQSSKKK